MKAERPAEERFGKVSGVELTRAQLLLWTGQQLRPEAPLYNMAFAFSIEGKLEPARFVRAFEAAVWRHDALRTVIEVVAGTPSQRVLSDEDVAQRAGFGVQLLDLSGTSGAASNARQTALETCQTAFDLSHCLYRCQLLRVAKERFVWVFAQHHIITDAWSMSLVFQSVSEAYAKLEASDESALTSAPSFAGFVHTSGTQDPPSEVQDYWQSFAQQDLLAPRLYGGPREVTSTASRRVDVPLGRERSDALRRLAMDPAVRGLTLDSGLFHLLVALTFAYQYRVSAQPTLAIGALAHNRTSLEQRELAGLLTEAFPLSVELAKDETFRTLLAKVRESSLGFMRWAQSGAGDARNNRVFHTIVNYIRGSFPSFAGRPVTTKWLHPGHQDAEHQLRVHAHDFSGTGELRLEFDLNTEAFAEPWCSRAVGHFLRLTDALLDGLDQPIADIDLLAQSEKDEQLSWPQHSFAGSAADEAMPSVVESFLRQVELCPEQTVLVEGERRWNYREMAAWSGTIAAKLDPSPDGSGPVANELIGVLLPRSAEAVASFLGILRAGLAYVPLDPYWPPARLEEVVSQSGVTRVLLPAGARTSADSLARGLRASGIKAVRVPEPGSSANGFVDRPLDSRLPAYVMFTSGSTGSPKGVVIDHGALSHYVAFARRAYVDPSQSRGQAFPLFSPLTFDLTVTSIFTPLTSGGQILVYPTQDPRADLAFLDVVEDQRVDIIKLTPSHLSLLAARRRDLANIASLDTGAEPQRRVSQLIFGGEALSREAVLFAQEIFGPEVTIHNEYGPTEATVGCVVHTFDPEADRGTSVPIGRTIADMRAFILDHDLGMIPVGVPGELYLSGRGLAQGYLHQPQLTSESFLRNPFEEGETLYRTGDLVRLTANGLLEYLGRVDDQVKVRGARIELGEIEAALAQHPDVERVAVRLVVSKGASRLASVEFCSRCALPSNYPGTRFDRDGVCNRCLDFEAYRSKVEGYFRTPADFGREMARVSDHSTGDYDCLALLSGGKDSTYVLCQLVDMGYRVLAFTLDNGFISRQAKANIRRVVDALQVDHVFAETPAMPQIFADSLKRHSNVCQGCFKTIYTLSLQTAKREGIPCIVTGLSRGQFFETRLSEELFTDPHLRVEDVDEMVLRARKAYHQVDDAVRQLLDMSIFDEGDVLSEVQFLDFYRYHPVELDDLMAYLDERVPWVRPTDTGRSTNCLINDVGIYVHQKERGFHNYALPYSWDVRMGHKTRAAALDELHDEIDQAEVDRMLSEIGYTPARASYDLRSERLVAFYVSPALVESERVMEHLAERLPDFMMPSECLRLEALPLTSHGKLDGAALDSLASQRSAEPSDSETDYVAPRTGVERLLAGVFSEVLGVGRIGIRDDFFALGGDSIQAIQIVSRAHRQGLRFKPALLFESLTIEALAMELSRAGARAAGPAADTVEGSPEGDSLKDSSGQMAASMLLAPAQSWLLERDEGSLRQWNQLVWLEVAQALSGTALATACQRLLERHQALRLTFRSTPSGWEAAEAPGGGGPLALQHVRLPDTQAQCEALYAEMAVELGRPFSLTNSPLLRVALFHPPAQDESSGGDLEAMALEPVVRVLLVAHHLIVDAVSWSILLQDLAQFAGDPDSSPGRGGEFLSWCESASAWARSMPQEALTFWLQKLTVPAESLPVESRSAESRSAQARSAERVPAQALPSAPTEVRPKDGGPGYGQSHRIVLTLDAVTTECLLKEVPRKARVRVHELLSAALALTLGHLTGSQTVRWFAEGHGRESVDRMPDTAEMVGWLATLYPVVISLPQSGSLSAILRAAKQQLREHWDPQAGQGAEPESGLSYSVLRYLGSSEVQQRLADLERRELVFNYLGRSEQWLGTSGPFRLREPLRLVRGARFDRPFRIELNAAVVEDSLAIEWLFDPERDSPKRVEDWGRDLLSQIRRLVSHAVSDKAAPTVVAEDFPLANLDAAKLGKLSKLLSGKKGSDDS